MLDEKNLTNVVNGSGFPLQIKLMDHISKTTHEHGWRISCYEHSWKDHERGQEGFIDIAITNRHNTLTLIIECKRAQDTAWVFINSNNTQKKRTHIKGWLTSTGRAFSDKFCWVDLQAEPRCFEADFAIINGQSNQSKPLLERVGADLVFATEAFAKEDRSHTQATTGLCVYLSAIITTIPLYACDIPPDNITLSEGKVAAPKFTVQPYVRFRKQLTTQSDSIPTDKHSPAHVRAQHKERTIFVVNADNISLFLRELEIIDTSLNHHLAPYTFP